MSDLFATLKDTLQNTVQPMLQPVMFGYLSWFYVDIAHGTFAAHGDLSGNMIGAIMNYGAVLAIMSAAISISVGLAQLIGKTRWGSKDFHKALKRSTNSLILVSIFQLFPIYVMAHRLGLDKFDDGWSVTAGIITLFTALMSYAAVDMNNANEQMANTNSLVVKATKMIVGIAQGDLPILGDKYVAGARKWAQRGRDKAAKNAAAEAAAADGTALLNTINNWGLTSRGVLITNG